MLHLLKNAVSISLGLLGVGAAPSNFVSALECLLIERVWREGLE